MTAQLHYLPGQKVLFRTDDNPMGRERKEGVVTAADAKKGTITIECEGKTFVRDEAACIGRTI